MIVLCIILMHLFVLFLLVCMFLDSQDIKEFMRDEWRDLACVIGSRMRTKVK